MKAKNVLFVPAHSLLILTNPALGANEFDIPDIETFSFTRPLTLRGCQVWSLWSGSSGK